MFDCTLVQLKYNQKLIKNTIKTKDVVLENDLIRLFTNAKKALPKMRNPHLAERGIKNQRNAEWHFLIKKTDLKLVVF